MISINNSYQTLLKEFKFSQSILSLFDHVQNYLCIKGNLKIVVSNREKQQKDNDKP